MPGLPDQRNAQVIAHLYVRNDHDLKEDTQDHLQNSICYIAEEGYLLNRHSCTVLVNIAGLDEIISCLNVKRFLQIRKNCQWIKVMTYVDDELLAEACPDYKYNFTDIEQSDYELLSMPFKLNKSQGRIQLVVKTHGPGKKWPDYAFNFDYYDSRETLAKLIPSKSASMKSFKFRDVDKKSEILMDKLKEVQYAADDRMIKEKIEAEAEAERKASDITERVKRGNDEIEPNLTRRSITPEAEGCNSKQMTSSSSATAIKRRRLANNSNDDYELYLLSRQAEGSSSARTNQPAPLMMNSSASRMISRAPIPDRRW